MRAAIHSRPWLAIGLVTTLKQLPSRIVPFSAFADAFPQGEVLARPAGSDRPYGRNPYVGYDNVTSSPFAFPGKADSRLRPMERALGVRVGSYTLVHPLSKLRSNPVINDDVRGEPLVVVAAAQMRSPLDGSRISESRSVPAAAAFDRRVQGRVLDFTWRNRMLVDEQTGSEWDIFGRAVRGPLAGTALTSVDGGVHFAFAWLAFNPRTRIR